jgi:DNA modification methylase
MIKLMQGDCLERMKEIPDGSVDMILCDLPYGTTACKWDTIIPFEPLWGQYKRIVKKNGAVVLFGSQPFTSALVMSNSKMFKYALVWNKNVGGAFVLAKKRILPSHEDILIFGVKQTTYNPQMTVKPIENRRPMKKEYKDRQKTIKMASGMIKHSENYNEEENYPTSILLFPKQMQECNNLNRVHPTQKPVSLLEYLIKTYTNEGETVLDNTMGSGSTGVAAKNLNRSFIGIELDESYFQIAKKRIEEAIPKNENSTICNV